ncbi:hypothetical protein NC652_002827 [Populus alba x Populus x berolinensis]|nr:hypothetical protein NC652_002827 [Populus alba x Populus x berolinensis]
MASSQLLKAGSQARYLFWLLLLRICSTAEDI